MSGGVQMKELKLLCLQSGNTCAFPGCNRSLTAPGTSADDPVITGQAAHIIAESRQGPRGACDLSDDDRNRAENLVMLCSEHHKVVDAQPNTYSVAVMRQMKLDHAARVRQAMDAPVTAPASLLVTETLQSTLLPITHVPQFVYSAPCAYGYEDMEELKKRIVYPEGSHALFPFILRDGKLFAFQDLRDASGAFAAVVDPAGADPMPSTTLWQDPEGHRRYVNLLNRAMFKYTGRLGIRYDPEHRRYYFPPQKDGSERSEKYVTLAARKGRRKVAWQPRSKATGEARSFWWHLAAGLRFLYVGTRQWCLSIRPERRLTTDGVTPMPSHRIGRRVTRLKARMYNYLYLEEVHFWRDYLRRRSPRLLFDFGAQSMVIDARFVEFRLRSPGIPGDDRPYATADYEEDLFTLTDLSRAERGDDPEVGDEEELTIEDEGEDDVE